MIEFIENVLSLGEEKQSLLVLEHIQKEIAR